MTRLLIIALTALLLAAPVLAGNGPEPLPLSLAEANRRALARNHDVAIQRESFTQGELNLFGVRGAYDPLLDLESSYHQNTDPVNSTFSGAPPGELAPKNSGFSVSTTVSQLLPTGASLSLTSTVGRDRTNNIFSLLSPAYTTSVGLSLRQPLLQNFGIDAARQAIRIAIIDRDVSAATLKRVVSQTIAAVEARYWTLVAARRNVEVLESAVELASKQLRETQSRVEVGSLGRTELAQPRAELERRRGDLASAREQAKRAEIDLKVAILGSERDSDWNRPIVPTDEPSVTPHEVDVEAATVSALLHRPEMAEAAGDVARSEVSVEAGKSGVLPRFDVVASYTRRGLAGSANPDALSPFGGSVVVPRELEGGLGRSLGTISENQFPDASIGISFSVPIGNRSARAKLAVARSMLRQTTIAASQEEQTIAAEVQNAADALDTARQRIDAARAGREAAETQLFAEQEKFAVGLSTNFFVLTRQNDLTSARQTEITALTDYEKAATEFARSAGTLLEERQIEVAP